MFERLYTSIIVHDFTEKMISIISIRSIFHIIFTPLPYMLMLAMEVQGLVHVVNTCIYVGEREHMQNHTTTHISELLCSCLVLILIEVGEEMNCF